MSEMKRQSAGPRGVVQGATIRLAGIEHRGAEYAPGEWFTREGSLRVGIAATLKHSLDGGSLTCVIRSRHQWGWKGQKLRRCMPAMEYTYIPHIGTYVCKKGHHPPHHPRHAIHPSTFHPQTPQRTSTPRQVILVSALPCPTLPHPHLTQPSHQK